MLISLYYSASHFPYLIPTPSCNSIHLKQSLKYPSISIYTTSPWPPRGLSLSPNPSEAPKSGPLRQAYTPPTWTEYLPPNDNASGPAALDAARTSRCPPDISVVGAGLCVSILATSYSAPTYLVPHSQRRQAQTIFSTRSTAMTTRVKLPIRPP